MNHRAMNPPSVYSVPEAYSQVTSVELTSQRLLFVSGQVALDAQGRLVGLGDMARQAEQAFENLRLLLEAEGCHPADVVKLGIFTTDISQRAAVSAVRSRFFPGAKPASTFIEVRRLASDDWLIEIEAYAATPNHAP